MEPPKTRRFKFYENLNIMLIFIGLIISALSIDYDNIALLYFGVSIFFFGGIFYYIKPNTLIQTNVVNILNRSYVNYFQDINLKTNNAKWVFFYSAGSLDKLFKPEMYKIIDNRVQDMHVSSGSSLISDIEEKYRIKYTSQKSGSAIVSKISDRYNFDYKSEDLDLINRILHKYFVEDLMILNDFNISLINDIIQVELVNYLLHQSYKDLKNYSLEFDPVVGTIACVLSRLYKLPIIIIDYESIDTKININFKTNNNLIYQLKGEINHK